VNFFGTYWVLVPLIALSVVWGCLLGERIRARDAVRVALLAISPLCSLLHGLYIMRLGGDYMHGRMWVPIVFAWLLPVAALAPTREGSLSLLRRFAPALALVVVSAWSVVCAAWLRVDSDNQHGIGDERGWQIRMANHPNPIALAEHRQSGFAAQARYLQRMMATRCAHGRLPQSYGATSECDRYLHVLLRYYGRAPRVVRRELSASAPPGMVAAVGLGAIGLSGYLLGSAVHVVDVQGPGDPIASRMPRLEGERPGHDKFLPRSYLMARFADPFLFEPSAVTAARRALRCSDLAELEQAVAAPLSLKRFVKNITLAWHLSRLRIPRDPFEAEREFCDDGES
jgi:arabinofuranosyltransferase